MSTQEAFSHGNTELNAQTKDAPTPSISGTSTPTFTVASLISKTWSTFWKSPVYLALMAIPLTIPEVLYDLFVSATISVDQTALRDITRVLFAVPAIPFYIALLIRVFQILEGRKLDSREAVQLAKHHFLCAAAILITFQLPLILLPELGLYVFLVLNVFFICVIPCCIVERTDFRQSFTRAYELSQGYRLKIFGVYFLLVAITGIVSAAFIFITVFSVVPDQITYSIPLWITMSLFTLFSIILEGVCYHILSAINDGARKDALATLFD